MWPSREDKHKNVNFDYPVVVAIVISIISLAIAVGLARWSWLLLDEQTTLRKDFVDLSARQDQIDIQYEFWLEQLEQDLDEVKALKE